jgi:hypothetical protein
MEVFMQIDRRIRRSDETTEALTLQLAATATRAACTAVVLSEKDGLAVAEVGDDGSTEEIAAMAPMLARDGRRWHGTVHTSWGDRLVTITPMPSAHGALYLCAVGGQICTLGAELISGGRGVLRILS